MPIEIKELIIKTTIVDRPTENWEESTTVPQALKDEILIECRKLVLNLLRERGER